jgi:cytokinin dehydrogenase
MKVARALQQLPIRARMATDSATLAAYSRDFARLTKRLPDAVASPQSVPDLIELITWAAREGIPIALRGSGHSQAGHTLLESGVVVDLRALNHVGEVDFDARLVEAEAGATWADVVERTLPAGLAPRVLTSEHATSIGGTLSVGGLGGTSFRYGAQVGNVAYLDVVTGKGELVRCSSSQNRELFDVVRAGLGQFGVIVRAGLLLRQVKPRVRTFMYAYDSADAFLEDLRQFLHADEGTHLLAHFTPITGSERAQLRLTVGIEHFRGAEPEYATPRNLQCSKTLPFVDTELFGEDHIFFFRYASWFGTSAEFVYPWVDHYFAWDRAREYLSPVLTGRFSPLFKMGVNTIIPIVGDADAAPLLTRSGSAEPMLLVGLFPKLPVALADLSEMVVSYAKRIEDEFGASRYLYGFLDTSRTAWPTVFRDHWSWMQEMKRRYDPFGIFNPELLRLASSTR